MIDDLWNTPNTLFSFFGRHFLVVCIFSIVSLSTVSIVAQEAEAPAEPAPVVESVPESTPEPAPEPTLEVIPEPAPEPDPQESQSEPTPEAPSDSGGSSSDSEPAESSSESSSSPDSPTSATSETPSSSLTLLETGDGVIPLLEWLLTPETEEIFTLFSNSDFLIEVEVIFSDLDTEVDTEIQNEPTLADNTDEDPNVDLIDPSIIPNPAGPLPEPETELPLPDDAPVTESQTESQSTLALLESLLSPEELTVRRYDKEIILDESATHTCRADIFRADLNSSDFSRARVTLFQNRKKTLPSFLEIWALPAGIHVVFKKNEDYNYAPGTRETVIEFDITRQIGADEGDFTIPIIYTLEEWKGSSVVCQINILND